MKKKLGGFVVLVSLSSLISVSSLADSSVPVSGGQDQYSIDLASKGLKRKTAAMCLLKDMMTSAGKGAVALADKSTSFLGKVKATDSVIPAGLYSKAKCVVVIPGDLSVGIAGYGLNYGAGISRCRDDQGKFGEPQFVKLDGGSYGFQLGAKSTDRVLLFMNPSSDLILKNPSLKLGADIGAAAGPIGRDVEADTNLHMQDKVLGYSRSGGLYAGIALDGAVLTPDTKMTEAVEGETVKRGFFEKVGHGIGGLFHHKNKGPDVAKEQADAKAEEQALDTCDQTVAMADEAPGLNSMINKVASQDAGAPVNSSTASKPVQVVATAAQEAPTQDVAGSLAGAPPADSQCNLSCKQ